MNNAKKIVQEVIDHLADGFIRLDPRIVTSRPPKVKWGDEFKSWPMDKKITYLTKFGEAMNHAADILQKERDNFASQCILKEGQIKTLHMQMRQNNEMLQHEVTKFNEQRQGYNKEIARLNTKIRELESGD